MRGRSVNPIPARHVDVARADRADFTRAHTRATLQLDHGPYLTRDVGANGIDGGIGDGTYWLGLAYIAAASTEPINSDESVVLVRREQLCRDTPFEHLPDPAHLAVNDVATPS
jgi:hypothetical protein